MKQLKNYFLIALLFFLTSGVYAETDQAAVEKVYYSWCESIGKARGEAEKVVKYYAPGAILLPTLSPDILVNTQNGLNAYFTNLTSNPNIKCIPHKLITMMEGNIAINSGTYTFSYGEKGETIIIPARFTFIYKKIGNDWKIITHHSSQLPNNI